MFAFFVFLSKFQSNFIKKKQNFKVEIKNNENCAFIN